MANTESAATVLVGMATRPGTESIGPDGEDLCADGAHVQRRGDQVTAAVVDGAGHRPEVVDLARHAPR
ncbi:hypothetical protein ACGFX7_05960 [Streptomyces harbinensis]|uniref:hypothetical protein n=1 Tax=Streptomyces harbinensis TaxID=1176198 RepID=UPI00371BC3E9